ncbi:hypothetical protein [Sphaerisporangium aureirubrum]|uniref:Uncharacterized protein n=1 Tax=Sphaerisporangium aureirubrum TaxID=1544736 RepID=A0ABW1NCZ2_9ACTN
MSRERSDPPLNWAPFPVTKVTDDIYYGWPEDERDPWFWHWCTGHAPGDQPPVDAGRWSASGTGLHTLVSREPLHLEPSLHWLCCGLHGFVRNGYWTPV